MRTLTNFELEMQFPQLNIKRELKRMAIKEAGVSPLHNYMESNVSESDALNFPSEMTNLVSQVLDKNWTTLSYPLSQWQQSQLKNLGEFGVRCLLKMWFSNERYEEEGRSNGTYCNATWDNVYCWPPTRNGSIASRPCSEILQNTAAASAQHIQGNAVRVCSANGTWLWGNWTNYTECADSYEEYIRKTEEEKNLVVIVQHILFIGSILSVGCLSTSLLIFYFFKRLWCDRVRIYSHLMAALLLRCVLLIIITEPFMFNRTNHYRNVDIICKAVLSTNMYATVASINWMFVQGLYLHGKLTTNVFDRKPPFKLYIFIGWVLPLLLVIAYATTVEILHPVKCWKDYSERSELWILLGPMIIALLANLLFLINIMRIMLTKVQLPNSSSDSVQLRRAIKATFILFPLLGITNLLFLYNPGGEFNKFFVVLNTGFGSTQGIFVSILYCFLSKDVRDAIGRRLRQFSIQWSIYSIRRRQGLNRQTRNASEVTSFVTFSQVNTQPNMNVGESSSNPNRTYEDHVVEKNGIREQTIRTVSGSVSLSNLNA